MNTPGFIIMMALALFVFGNAHARYKLPHVPAGVGLQSNVGQHLLLRGNVGSNPVLSDDLAHRERINNLNRFTTGKHGGFYEIMAGIVYTGSLLTNKK